MKKYINKTFFLILLDLIFFQGSRAQSSWRDPNLKPDRYHRILVIAKIKDPIGERDFEDATVAKLREKGISAIPQYSSIAGADTLSDDSFNRITDSLGIDGLLVYALEAPGKVYQRRSSVSLGVGIPFRLGIFGGFLGTHVPLAGGTQVITVVNGNASFYNRSSKNMQWSNPFSGSNEGWGDLADKIARVTVRSMIRDQIFIR